MKEKVYPGTEAFEVEWCIHVPSDNAYGQLQLDDAKFVAKLCKDQKAVERLFDRIFRRGGAIGRIAVTPVMLTDPFATDNPDLYQWEPTADPTHYDGQKKGRRIK